MDVTNLLFKCDTKSNLQMIAGRAGVPMEVMGLMLGQFVDDYTITCVDVFAMPQVFKLGHGDNSSNSYN